MNIDLLKCFEKNNLQMNSLKLVKKVLIVE